MKNMNKLNDAVIENVAGGIFQDEALAKALAHAGLSKSQVNFIKPVELDYEHGWRVFDTKFYQGGFEYDFDVDAETGAILKFEKDFDD